MQLQNTQICSQPKHTIRYDLITVYPSSQMHQKMFISNGWYAYMGIYFKNETLIWTVRIIFLCITEVWVGPDIGKTASIVQE